MSLLRHSALAVDPAVAGTEEGTQTDATTIADEIVESSQCAQTDATTIADVVVGEAIHVGTFADSLPMFTVASDNLAGGETIEIALTLPAIDIDEFPTSPNPAGGIGTVDADFTLMDPIIVLATGITGNSAPASSTLPALTATGNDTTQTGSGSAILGEITATSTGITGHAGTFADDLPIFTASGADPDSVADRTATASGTLGFFTIAVTGGAGMQDAVAITLPSLTASASGYTGNVATATGTLGEITVTAVGAAGDTSGTASMELPEFLFESYGSGRHISSYLLDEDGFSLLTETGAKIVLEEYDAAHLIAAGLFTGALNTKAAAPTEYGNFPFNSFAEYRGVIYGASYDGIHSMDNADDNGTDISALIKKTDIDYGTTNIKRATDAYVRLRSDGDYTLTVVADGTESNKSVTDSNTGVHTKKVQLGRGLKGRGLGFGISNTDGSEIDVDEVELLVEVGTRRRRQ